MGNREAFLASTLRFSTAGSVDDGKSTLIGRLLLDAKGLMQDQLAAVARSTQRRGDGGLDLALFTDGLTAEREQGITIDVAYRYFATPTRRFIIADTPGHEQYTRNMVTGASTADLSIVLVDATRGVLQQTRRHAAIAALLGIRTVVFAVNKMDAADYDRATFDRIALDIAGIARALGIQHAQVIPLSALQGDMVVERGEHLAWYHGPTLLRILESAPSGEASPQFRFPVQLVSHTRFGATKEFRGYLGRVESGRVAAGDAITVLPSGATAKVAQVLTHDGAPTEAVSGQSVTLVLDRQVDVARGDLLVHAADAPQVAKRFTARLAWMDAEALSTSRRYFLKHGTQTVRATIEALESKLDLATLQPDASATTLAFNDLGTVKIAVARALPLDRYADNRANGRFVLIDEATHQTVAAGMVEAVSPGEGRAHG